MYDIEYTPPPRIFYIDWRAVGSGTLKQTHELGTQGTVFVCFLALGHSWWSG